MLPAFIEQQEQDPEGLFAQPDARAVLAHFAGLSIELEWAKAIQTRTPPDTLRLTHTKPEKYNTSCNFTQAF